MILPICLAFDIIHMNIYLLFVDVFLSIIDDDTLCVSVDPLSIGIVEDVWVAVAMELDGGNVVGGTVSVVEHEGEVGIAFSVSLALDGIRHALGQLEV